MLLAQSSVAGVLNPPMSSCAQLTEQKGRREGSVGPDLRREKERMKPSDGKKKTCDRERTKGKGYTQRELVMEQLRQPRTPSCRFKVLLFLISIGIEKGINNHRNKHTHKKNN